MHITKKRFTALACSALCSLALLEACVIDDTVDKESGNQNSTSSGGSGDSSLPNSGSGSTTGEPGSGGSGGAAPGESGGSIPGEAGDAGAEGDPNVDDEPGGAKDLGILGTQVKSFGTHALSEHDSVDYFRFEVPQFGKTLIRFKKESDSSVRLVITSANPNSDQGKEIIDPMQYDRNQDHVLALPKGAYFLKASHSHRDYVPYTLSMVHEIGDKVPEEGPEPGNHFDEARQLGSIGSSSMSLAGYVGTIDQSDYFRFSAPANRTVKLSPAEPFGAYEIVAYKADGVSGTRIRSWGVSALSKPEPEFKTNEGGEFFIEVKSERDHGALYRFRLGLL